MILLIDNYDSFTFNLYQYLGELGEEVVIYRNDKITLAEIETLKPEAIVLSPGPGRPENAGIVIEVIRHFCEYIPILGICLGHQAIGYAFGGEIINAEKIMHGKTSEIVHKGEDLFHGLPENFEVMRYHSLVIERATLPSDLKVMAVSIDDQEIMAVKHKEYPVYGLQFHPESVGTSLGKQILENYLAQIRREQGNETISATIV